MPLSNSELKARLESALGERIAGFHEQHGQLTMEVKPGELTGVALALRDHAGLRFTILIDLCGVDYSAWKNVGCDGPRFAVVYNLLSIEHNCRLRVRVFAQDNDFPVLDSVIEVWPAANWYEREAFDLYGIVFEGHNDLRRLLTDYGFIGHPFRKDFPLSGNVEMRYDPDQKRVVYQPVTIEPREITPRIVREDNYAQNE